MKQLVHRLSLACVAACLAVFAGEARAGLITATSVLDTSLAVNVQVTFDGVSSTFRAGPFTTTVYDGGVQVIQATSYCVDLTERVNPNEIPASLVVTNGVLAPSGQRGDIYPRLMGAAAWLTGNIKPMTNLEHAALQVAIWEAIYDYDYGMGTALGPYVDATTALATGLFVLQPTTNASVIALATSYLTMAWSGTQYKTRTGTVVDYPPGGPRPFSQDQILVTPVPEPSSFILLGCGAIGLFGLSRWRRTR